MVDLTASTDFTNLIDDARIKAIRPLIPPQILMEDLPLSFASAQTVLKGRRGAEAILKGEDDRLIVVVGPCSVHDVKAALEYANLLKVYAQEAEEDLHILMRVYFEKPRTTVGWKGLINDPQLNGSFSINKGYSADQAQTSMGLPTAVEFLDTISPQFIADTVSWGAIGARTTESQVHRELSSGLSAPIGFKNGTDGSVSIAVDAMRAAKEGHVFLSVTKHGISAIVETNGNPSTHVILRGSNRGPNFSAAHVKETVAALKKANLPQRVMIDCSHGNSEKNHENQPKVAADVAQQLASPETGFNILGVMIESNLVAGKQSIPTEGPTFLKYGQSVTDACIDWETTVTVLDSLRQGVQARRKLGSRNGLNGIEAQIEALTPAAEQKDFNDLSFLSKAA